MTYYLGNPSPGLVQAQKCGRVKPNNGIQNPPLLITGNWISNGNTYINKQQKNLHRFASLKKTHHKNE
jgi:hypothetical protein